MEKLEDYLDFARISANGAKSLREYVREVLFNALDKKRYSLQELSNTWKIPYETIVRYRSGSIPMTSKHVMLLNCSVALNQSDLVPIRTLTEGEKFRLWQECCSLGIGPMGMPSKEGEETSVATHHEYDLEIAAMDFQGSIVSTRILKKFDDSKYDVLMPKK